MVFGGQEYCLFDLCLFVLFFGIGQDDGIGVVWIYQVDVEGGLVWQCGVEQMDGEVVVDFVIGELVDLECGDDWVIVLFVIGQFFYVVGYIVVVVFGCGCCCWFVVVFMMCWFV